MARKKMNALDVVAITLLIIGGLNWGVIGVTDLFGDAFNLVEMITYWAWLTNTVYVLVGLAALYSIWTFIKLR